MATDKAFKIHHGGKSGDLIYALPVMKALARRHGGKIRIVTSPLCYQIVPLLWEQPYIEDVEMDYSQPYKITENCIDPWAVLSPEEGLNLSPQPAMYRPDAPVAWTHAYAEIAGVSELEPIDTVGLPSLWNHRQWFYEHNVEYEDKPNWEPPMTAVLAPESESLKTAPMWVWDKIADKLCDKFAVVIVGQQRVRDDFSSYVNDLRGLTTMPLVARILAEARVVVSSLSLPFHVARHAGTPTWCLQDQVFERSMPVDTPYRFYTTDKWEKLVEEILWFADHPQTTLWPAPQMRRLQEQLSGSELASSGSAA